MILNQKNPAGQKHGPWEEKVHCYSPYNQSLYNWWRGRYVNGKIEGLWVCFTPDYDFECIRINFVNDEEEGEKIIFQ